MKTIKNPAFWVILIIIIIAIYFAYKWYQYLNCKSQQGKTCQIIETDTGGGSSPTGKQIIKKIYCDFWKGKICQ